MKEGWLHATLAEKIPEQIVGLGCDPVGRLLARESSGLFVEWEFSLRHRWVEVRARGEDAEAFLNLLVEKFGSVPVYRSRVEMWDVAKGFVVGAGRVGFGVYVDLGIFEPALKDGLYPLHRMRAQLADGASKPCREILVENGIGDDFPVSCLVTEVDGDKVSVELDDETRELLWSWRRLPFDRVVATGVAREEAVAAVRSAELEYDVIRIESLSLLTQCLVCKMGTEAPGVISKIGRRLRGVGLTAYDGSKRPEASY